MDEHNERQATSRTREVTESRRLFEPQPDDRFVIGGGGGLTLVVDKSLCIVIVDPAGKRITVTDASTLAVALETAKQLIVAAEADLQAEREQNIHCPRCGSHNVECVEKPRHNHICHDCGYTALTSTAPDQLHQ
jgi:predicted RNA-binding Zn-ribbon protein involved in translation (DUF1610 family)